MNKISRIIAVLLCFVMVIISPVCVFANNSDFDWGTDIIPINPGGSTGQPDKPADKSVLEAIIDMASDFNEEDYTAKTFGTLQDIIAASNAVFSNEKATQGEVDEAVTNILTAINSLVPYLNLSVLSKHEAPIVTYDDTDYFDKEYSILYGTEVTVSAPKVDGYVFDCWFETVSKRIFSNESEFTFVVSTNLSLEARYVPVSSSSIMFSNGSGQIVKTVTKTVAQWEKIKDISYLLPEVPYSYGKTNGRWNYDNDSVLSSLRNGNNVGILAIYDGDGVQDSIYDNDGVNPNGVLKFDYNSDAEQGSFIMSISIPESYEVNSIGVAFRYGKDDFDPTKIMLNLNNKNVVSQFDPVNLENTYIVNTKTTGRSWAAVGYVNYFDEDGNIKTYYTNQVNVVNNESV